MNDREKLSNKIYHAKDLANTDYEKKRQEAKQYQIWGASLNNVNVVKNMDEKAFRKLIDLIIYIGTCTKNIATIYNDAYPEGKKLEIIISDNMLHITNGSLKLPIDVSYKWR